MHSRPVAGDVLSLNLGMRDTDLTAREFVCRCYDDHRDVIWRYLRSLGIDPHDAQELTQEVFIKLYEVVRRGTEIRVPRAWLFAVASHVAIDHHRGITRRGADAAKQATVELHMRSHADSNPEQALLDRETSASFVQALEMLSPQQRICIHLRAEGLRYRQIAATLGISVPAVAEFLRRAIARLRTQLDKP